MFCPRCSQEQISEEQIFCSRCGLPLGLVAEVLAGDGYLPQSTDTGKSKKFFTRRKGIIFSIIWFMFFLFIMSPFFAIVGVPELAAVSAVLGVFGGIIWLIVSFLLLKDTSKKDNVQIQEMPSQFRQNLSDANQHALPAQTYSPPANTWRAPNTGELIQPQSVTEGTTKLLEKDR